MALVRVHIRSNPFLAFAANVNAYETFPYQIETRRQLPGALLGLTGTGRAEIDRDAAEIIWAISQSVSPWDTAGLVSRGSYLLNFGRANELGPIAERLKRVAPWHVETWIIEGYVALSLGDKERLGRAVTKAQRLARGEDATVATLAEQLRKLP